MRHGYLTTASAMVKRPVVSHSPGTSVASTVDAPVVAAAQISTPSTSQSSEVGFGILAKKVAGDSTSPPPLTWFNGSQVSTLLGILGMYPHSL